MWEKLTPFVKILIFKRIISYFSYLFRGLKVVLPSFEKGSWGALLEVVGCRLSIMCWGCVVKKLQTKHKQNAIWDVGESVYSYGAHPKSLLFKNYSDSSIDKKQENALNWCLVKIENNIFDLWLTICSRICGLLECNIVRISSMF